MKSKPSDFTNDPMNSVFRKSEAETVASNAMVILKRTGDTFRNLSNEEYEKERRKDGNWSNAELHYLEKVRPYLVSADMAMKFSPYWA